MDGRDRDTYARYDERPPRLRSTSPQPGSRRPTGLAGRRFEEDLELSDDPPTWEDRFGGRRRPLIDPDAAPSRSPRQEVRSGAQTSSSRSPSSRASRYAEPVDDVIEERHRDLVADPYDRLRRIGERRSRPTVDRDRDRFPDLDELGADEEPVPRPTRRRTNEEPRAARPVRPVRPSLPQAQLRAVGGALARSSQDAGALLPLVGVACASALALAVLTLARLGSTADWLVVRLDASGEPTRWASNDALWRVPLLLVFSTVAGLVVAWRLRRHDAFAAQFTLVAVLLLHGFGWVAAGRLLF